MAAIGAAAWTGRGGRAMLAAFHGEVAMRSLLIAAALLGAALPAAAQDPPARGHVLCVENRSGIAADVTVFDFQYQPLGTRNNFLAGQNWCLPVQVTRTDWYGYVTITNKDRMGQNCHQTFRPQYGEQLVRITGLTWGVHCDLVP